MNAGPGIHTTAATATGATVAVIINPISGTGRKADVARRRAELAASLMAAHQRTGVVSVTERPGHARELACAALEGGTSHVIVWGGDGTVNEVASVVAFSPATLGVIPSGSGNGLARELGIPLDPLEAFRVALNGTARRIDCGELDGRLFFNVAGLGLDARVAHQFAARGLKRRGFRRYAEITLQELFRFEAEEYTIQADGRAIGGRALIVAIANARQYGNGALIAPDARIDDGRLDVVIVSDRSPWRVLQQVPSLFRGRIARVPGVTMTPAAHITIGSARQMLYHVDGEPYVGPASMEARAHAAALRVQVPA
jgi:diacylglycerol kinase (ATP)